MKHINLYQAAFHPPRIILPARKLLAGGALFLCGLLALYAWDAWRLARLRQDVDPLASRAAGLEARINAGTATGQADPRVLAEIEAVENRLRNLLLAQEALDRGTLGSETGYSPRFRALARASVAGAWLTRVEIGARGQEMNLHGRALTGEDSARLIANLRREPLFVGLSFASLALAPPLDKAAEDSRDAGGKSAPPRFLEFALAARLPDAAPEAAAASAGNAPTTPPGDAP